MSITEKTIDGIDFKIHNMGAMQAAILDRKILSIVSSGIGGMLENGLSTEISLDKFISNLGDGLLKLSDNEYKDLLIKMFNKVIAIKTSNPPLELNNEENINVVFDKNLITMYKLIYEVMKHNGFSFFALAGGGLGIQQIFTSINQTETTKKD